MRILLFGEYSGFFNCLKDGLIALGHDVFLASNGDGPKDFPSDFRWDSKIWKGRISRIAPFYNVANIMLHKKMFSGYDVVLLIAPNNISQYTWLNRIPYDSLLENNKKVFLSGAGITPRVFNYWYNTTGKYRSYMEGYLYGGQRLRIQENKQMRQWEEDLMNRIDGYIPIWYEYAEPYRKHPKFLKTIRIPVNISQFEYKPNIVREGKIVFYHGITKECKGSMRYIKPAFDKLRKDYSDKAEFICASRLPFAEYMKVVDRTNVIVDDANSYSIAMNGLFSMLKGKLIMGGAEPVANEEYGYDYNPVYNINPDVDQICDTMIDIIKHKDDIEERGMKGRKFVEQYHDYKDIAQQYIDVFETC